MDTIRNSQYEKMTAEPVGKLVLSMGIPTTISMLITNIYNMADTFYVSRISISASGATGIVFALMAVLQAFGFMFGHGAGSNISRLLGAKKTERANVFTSTSVSLAFAAGILIGILGLLFPDVLVCLLGSTESIQNDAKTYGIFILISAPAMTVGCVLNNILRYEGRASFAMAGLCSGALLNLLLDPVLIYSCHMGIAGAGLSTAVSQYISTGILLLPFLFGKTVTKIRFRYISKTPKDIRTILTTGLPSLTRQGLNSVSTALLNVQAAVYGDAAVAAVSIVGRCGNLLFSFALGIAQGFQPVCAFNYGAGNYERVEKSAWFTLCSGIGIMGVLCALCDWNARAIIGFFRKEDEILVMGTDALRWMCRMLYLLPVSAVGSMLFQSVGKEGRSLLIAALQSGLFFIPLIFLLPRFFGKTGIWAAQPFAYLLAGAAALPIMVSFFRTLRKRRNECVP